MLYNNISVKGDILLQIENSYFWYFKYSILLIYFYFSSILNTGLKFVMEYFYIVVLIVFT